MLSTVKAAGGAEWSVLIMDAVTTRVMSSACRISDVLDFGVSRACTHSAPDTGADRLASLVDECTGEALSLLPRESHQLAQGLEEWLESHAPLLVCRANQHARWTLVSLHLRRLAICVE